MLKSYTMYRTYRATSTRINLAVWIAYGIAVLGTAGSVGRVHRCISGHVVDYRAKGNRVVDSFRGYTANEASVMNPVLLGG